MERYVIFGNGRVGVNMASYLKSLGHQVRLLTRQNAEADRALCKDQISQATIIIAAVPDSNIKPWFDEWRDTIGSRHSVHFSGAITVEGMHGFHPLYSFPTSELAPEQIKDILFACPAKGPSFETIFPKAPNPYFEIHEQDRARYHALAVLSGNMPSYLWNETAKEFSAITGMPPDKVMKVYLESIVSRFAESPMNSLTGPVARKDALTVKKNLQSLSQDQRLQKFYKLFAEEAWPDFKNNSIE